MRNLVAKVKSSDIFKDPGFYMVFAISVVFSVIFSYYTVLKYVSLNATAFDLGIYVQIFASTIHGQFFYTNLQFGSYLSEHFSPFVFLLYIYYLIFRSTESMLVLQSVMISFSGLLIYVLAREVFRIDQAHDKNYLKALAISISLTYMLSPYIESPLLFDFHLMPFLTFLVPLSFYSFIKGYKIINIVALALIVSLHSLFVLLVFFILVYQFWLHYRSASERNGTKLIDIVRRRKVILTALISIVILVGYLILATSLKTLIGTGVVRISEPATMSAGSVSGGIVGLLVELFTKPQVILSHFLVNFPSKLNFTVYAFAGTGYFSLLDPMSIVLDIPYFVYSYLSSYPSYYQLGYQYPSMIEPFIFTGAVYGLGRLLRPIFSKEKEKHNEARVIIVDRKSSAIRKKIIIGLVLIILVGTAFEFPLDPISPSSIFVSEGVMTDMPSFHYNDGSVVAFVLQSEIGNDNPYLLTINNVFPVFANDVNAYALAYLTNSHFINMIYGYKFEYLVNQPLSGWASFGSPSMNALVSNATFISHYGVYMESSGPSGVVVYKLDYTGQPILIVPYRENLSGSQFFTTYDEYNYSRSSGYIEFHNTTMGTAWFGPYITLLSGSYTVTFFLKAANSIGNSSIDIDVTSNSGTQVLAQRTIYASSLANDVVEQIIFHFTLSSTYYGVEFRGMDITWHGTLLFYGVSYYLY